MEFSRPEYWSSAPGGAGGGLPRGPLGGRRGGSDCRKELFLKILKEWGVIVCGREIETIKLHPA